MGSKEAVLKIRGVLLSLLSEIDGWVNLPNIYVSSVSPLKKCKYPVCIVNKMSKVKHKILAV